MTARRQDGAPIVGAMVCVNERCAISPENGRVRIDGISQDWHQVQLTITAGGFVTYSESVNLDPQGPPFRDVDWPDVYLQPAERPRLRIEGTRFVEDTQARWIWRGMTDFRLYQRFLSGEDLQPLIDERAAFGANTLRVLGMMHYITRFYPQDHATYYTALPDFAHRLAERGLRLEFVVFADAQVVMPRQDAQQQHFVRIVEAARDAPNIMLELVNEWKKNGVDPFRFSRPHGVLCSRGSGLADEAPPVPGWDYHTWHGRRDWPSVLFSNQDMWYIQAGQTASAERTDDPRPSVSDEPIGFAEVNEPGRRSTDPAVARILAVTSICYGQGGTFHSEDGIHSRPLGPVQAQCARAFFDGLRAIEVLV